MRLIFFCLLLTGCSDRFRYPCQDPDNWEKDFCKPPVCIVSETCPDMIIRQEGK